MSYYRLFFKAEALPTVPKKLLFFKMLILLTDGTLVSLEFPRILAATVALSLQNVLKIMHLCYIYFIVEILKGLMNRSI